MKYASAPMTVKAIANHNVRNARSWRLVAFSEELLSAHASAGFCAQSPMSPQTSRRSGSPGPTGYDGHDARTAYSGCRRDRSISRSISSAARRVSRSSSGASRLRRSSEPSDSVRRSVLPVLGSDGAASRAAWSAFRQRLPTARTRRPRWLRALSLPMLLTVLGSDRFRSALVGGPGICPRVSPAGHHEHPKDISTAAVEQELYPLGLLPVAARHLELGVDCRLGAPVRVNRVIRGARDLVRSACAVSGDDADRAGDPGPTSLREASRRP
jgi:hypothetical protein